MTRALAAAAAALLLLSACSGSEGEVHGDVAMTDAQQFEPSSLEVKVGETVEWANASNEVHTVTAYEGAPVYFGSGGADSEEEARKGASDGFIEAGETYEFTFDEPGTYEYFCIPHEGSGMKGTITVTE